MSLELAWHCLIKQIGALAFSDMMHSVNCSNQNIIPLSLELTLGESNQNYYIKRIISHTFDSKNSLDA